MAVTIIGTTDTCAGTAGSGIVTTWTLTGIETTYDGNLDDTDGYQILASMTWQDLSAVTATVSAEAITATTTSHAVIGTCVETLDEDGVPLHQWDTKTGNVAMCHWMYYLGQTNTSGITKNGTTGTDWSETRYLNRQEWGYGGSEMTGVAIDSIGTALTLTGEGFVRTPTIGVTLYTAASVYTNQWYQPKYQASYSNDALRRYAGATLDGDSVRGYCISARLRTSTTFFGVTAADKTGNIGAVTLSGAASLAASVIALGTLSLAF